MLLGLKASARVWAGDTDPTTTREPLPVLADHLSDLALPKHDYGKQVPGETRAQDSGEERLPEDPHLHQALLWTEGQCCLRKRSLGLLYSLFSILSLLRSLT